MIENGIRRAKAGLESLARMVGLRGVLGFPLVLAGLLTAPALDLYIRSVPLTEASARF
jgi:hypothetical protein